LVGCGTPNPIPPPQLQLERHPTLSGSELDRRHQIKQGATALEEDVALTGQRPTTRTDIDSGKERHDDRL
jgi:hypothetical protein